MKLKLKDEFINSPIYNPFENRTVIGKFIDERLYPHLYKKFPDLFEFDMEVSTKTTKKTKKSNDNTINNTEHRSGSNIEREIND